ncbi:MAG: AraC family transcriptional regulator [Pseudomonadota bacterium]
MLTQPNTHQSQLLIQSQTEFHAYRADLAWGHCAAVMDMTPLNSDFCTGLFVNQTWLAGDCLINQRAIDGNSHRHTKKHIHQTGGMVFVYRYLSGFSIGQSNDTPYSIHPGMIAISDYSRPFEGVQVAGVTQGIFIPHGSLGYKPGESSRLRLFSESSTYAQVIHREFDGLFSWLQKDEQNIPVNHLERIKDVLRLAIQGDCVHQDIRNRAREALKETICLFIERSLSDLNLSPRTILAQFGVSRATLFRIFEPEGGVRNYINSRRLFRAVHQISTNPLTRGEIHKAAERWGFSSDANFNRAVKRAFGTRPSALFEGPIEEVQLPDPSRAIWARNRAGLLNRGWSTL